MKKVRLNRDISILYRYGQRFFACRLAPLGVEVGQLPVLMQVYQMPGTTQDALSVGRGFDKGTTARVAKSLEDAGLLRRETDPDDRRINHLYPTGAGALAAPAGGGCHRRAARGALPRTERGGDRAGLRPRGPDAPQPRR